jgi:hypothetical protein
LGRIVELAILLIHTSIETVIRTRGVRKIAGQKHREFLVDSARIVVKGSQQSYQVVSTPPCFGEVAMELERLKLPE